MKKTCQDSGIIPPFNPTISPNKNRLAYDQPITNIVCEVQ